MGFGSFLEITPLRLGSRYINAMRRAVLALSGTEAGWCEGNPEDSEQRQSHDAARFGFPETAIVDSAF
jgi:hypothetical protein